MRDLFYLFKLRQDHRPREECSGASSLSKSSCKEERQKSNEKRKPFFQQTETYSDSDIFSASTSARRALTGLDELFCSCLFTV